MSKVNFETLLEAGVHFGHLKRKWNPAMAPYIFDEKKGIHIIDLNKTIAQLDHASAAIKQIAKSGKKVLFVATKKQAKDIVSERVAAINMPFVTERWSGGMLTNFQTTRKSIRKMTNIDKMKTDGTWTTLNKRERLFKDRQRDKLQKNFGSIADMTRQPAALFIVDILKEHIAVAEARKLNIPIFAMVDTNSNPKMIDFPIPANDDASKSITIILDAICEAIREGLEDRKTSKDDSDSDGEAKEKAPRSPRAKAEAKAVAAEEAVVAAAEETVVTETPEAVVEEVKVVVEEVAKETQALAEVPAVEEVVEEVKAETTSDVTPDATEEEKA